MTQIISRDEWDAAKPKAPLVPVTWPDGVDLWIHHSDTPAPSTVLSVAKAEVRAIQTYHIVHNGWNDIGYAYLVDTMGRLYMGRGEHIAAHSPGKNDEPSVCMLGTYDFADPPLAMREAIYWLADYINAGDLRGHRENTNTSCPGDRGMAVVVNGPPPPGYADVGKRADHSLTVVQRLMLAKVGKKSAIELERRLKLGLSGTKPKPTDSAFFRRLRHAGFGPESARAIVRAGRYTGKK